MSDFNLSIQPREAVKTVLNRLTSRRMKDVIEQRYGLKGRKKTLEAIGKEYKITRERVRQIEADALKQLSRGETLESINPIFTVLRDYINAEGGVVAESRLVADISKERTAAHIPFLLNIESGFLAFPETDRFHKRWALGQERANKVEIALNNLVKELDSKKVTLSLNSLHKLMAKHVKEVLGTEVIDVERVADSYLATSKLLKSNPYGEFGLTSWPSIGPRGIRDKAYMALARSGNPMHFRDVASAITKAGWSKRKAHPQTVHNELIKDHRFVLVGRGMYALFEWGYEPGVVREVMVSVLKGARNPLPKEEIIKLVLEKRMVKPPTVLLNLQNRNIFKKLDDGRYTLV